MYLWSNHPWYFSCRRLDSAMERQAWLWNCFLDLFTWSDILDFVSLIHVADHFLSEKSLAKFAKPPPYKLKSVAYAVRYFMALGMASGHRLVLHNKKLGGDNSIKSVAIRCGLFHPPSTKPSQKSENCKCPFKLLLRQHLDNPLEPVHVEHQWFVPMLFWSGVWVNLDCNPDLLWTL